MKTTMISKVRQGEMVHAWWGVVFVGGFFFFFLSVGVDEGE